MSSTDIRTQVKARLVDLIVARLAGAGETEVGVDYGVPANPWREHVWLDQTEGDLEIPTYAPVPRPYEDSFHTDIVIRVADPGALDARAIEARSAVLWGYVLDVLRDPAWGGSSLGGGILGLRAVKAERAVGPNSYQTPDGWVTAWRVTVGGESRITL